MRNCCIIKIVSFTQNGLALDNLISEGDFFKVLFTDLKSRLSN